MRRPNVMNVAIRVEVRPKPKGAHPLTSHMATARVRITPWGRFEVSAFNPNPHIARRLAQAQVLRALAQAIADATEARARFP